MNLSISNLLQTHPSTDFTFAEYAFAFVICMFIGSFIFEYFRKNKIENSSLKKATRSTASIMRWFAIVALLMTWTRLQGLPYFSMRIWWLVLPLVLAYWIYRTYRSYLKIEKRKARFEGKIDKDKDLKKYLPKKKKKK